jgi:hypothetical protein
MTDVGAEQKCSDIDYRAGIRRLVDVKKNGADVSKYSRKYNYRGRGGLHTSEPK